VNVLTEQSRGDGSWEYAISCIEYTEFSKLGITDVPVAPGSGEAQFPANANVLYVDLASVEQIASSKTAATLPGMVMNLKKPTNYNDHHGIKHRYVLHFSSLSLHAYMIKSVEHGGA
jgi:hypothetical protein